MLHLLSPQIPKSPLNDELIPFSLSEASLKTYSFSEEDPTPLAEMLRSDL